MKILLATHYLKNTGGTETYTYALAMELKRLGHEVEHYAVVQGQVSALLEEQGVPFMQHGRYDLIFANHTTAVQATFQRGFTIQTCHGVYPDLEQPSPFANAHVAVSDEVKAHLKEFGFESVVIPNGIDCERFRPKKPVSPTLSTVLSLSHSETANAFIRGCCEKIGVKFLKCNKYTDNVWNIEDVINEADLVIGLGRSAYDAMACGRCVLVYDFREQYMGEYLGDGMLTAQNIAQAMTHNCSGRASRLKYDETSFIAEMQKYSPQLAAWSREYAVEHLNIRKAAIDYLYYFDTLQNPAQK